MTELHNVTNIVCMHDLVNGDGSGYMDSLLAVVSRKQHQCKNTMSSVILQVLHGLYRNREVNFLRKAHVSPVYTRTTRTHLGWCEDGRFIAWDGYHGDQVFGSEKQLAEFLKQIENEIIIMPS